MILYDLAGSPNTRRVRIYLAEKGIELPVQPIDMAKGENRTDAFLAKNSLGKMPVLELDDGTCLAESVAICRYLEELHPEPPMFGRDTLERARVEMWNRRAEIQILMPVMSVFVHTHEMWRGRLRQVPDYAEVCRENVEQSFAWLDKELNGRTFIATDDYTVADITAQCAVLMAKAACGIRPAPDQANLTAWWDRVSARPTRVPEHPAMTYELHYWPTIQGRGEFVRLALEDAGIAYRDVARDPRAGERPLLIVEDGAALDHPPLAPPVLKVGSMVIAQTAAILLFLGERHGLAPKGEKGRYWAHQLQLTLCDLVDEVHDTHHPIASGRFTTSSARPPPDRAADFIATRAPKFLGYLENVLNRNPGGNDYLVGRRRSYADLSLFQVVTGLRYAFPRAMKRLEKKIPNVVALHDRIAARPRVRAYLASDRRIPFNEDGVFRRYPELDR